MALEFRHTTVDDGDSLADFLSQTFHLQSQATGFTLEDLHWKYWRSRADVPAPRSYILTDENNIVAHCGLIPANFSIGREQLNSAHFIDWAAAPKTLAAGAKVLRKTSQTVDLLFAVGGSLDTRRMLPLMGFATANEMVSYAIPLRPGRQLLTHQARNWKLPVRFLRNAAWSFRRTAPDRGWSFECSSPHQVPKYLWQSVHPAGQAGIARQASSYEYFLTCPFVDTHFVLLNRDGAASGCLLLTVTAGQARIADLWLREPSPEAFQAAYGLACRATLEMTSAVELVVAASIANRQQALQAVGFREYCRDQIMLLPAERAPQMRYDCQWIDNDGAYLTSGGREYRT